MTPHRQTVLVDANVWFSRTLRDWIGMLYTTPELPPFDVRWTEDILAEVVYHLRRTNPTWEGARITGLRERLAATFETGRVDHFTVDDDYRGIDPMDAHVHAAAVACRADYLVTDDSKGFVWDDNQSSYEVLTPDEFLVLVDDTTPDLVAAVTQLMGEYWLAQAGEAELPKRLRSAGCPQFAERVRKHLQHAF